MAPTMPRAAPLLKGSVRRTTVSNPSKEGLAGPSGESAYETNPYTAQPNIRKNKYPVNFSPQTCGLKRRQKLILRFEP